MSYVWIDQSGKDLTDTSGNNDPVGNWNIHLFWIQKEWEVTLILIKSKIKFLCQSVGVGVCFYDHLDLW